MTLLTACHIDERGQLDHVTSYMNTELKDQVDDIELIDVENIEERIVKNQFVVDGSVFYDGKDELIPSHQVKVFRAFSKKLDSYVFLIFNEHKDEYTMIQNYNCSQEKEDALNIVNRMQDIIESKDIKSLTYSKFTNESSDLEEVYILSKDYDVYTYIPSSPLWIKMSVNSSSDDLKAFKDDIQEVIDHQDKYISLEMKTVDNRKITFYKNGQPLIDTESGFQTEF